MSGLNNSSILQNTTMMTTNSVLKMQMQGSMMAQTPSLVHKSEQKQTNMAFSDYRASKLLNESNILNTSTDLNESLITTMLNPADNSRNAELISLQPLKNQSENKKNIHTGQNSIKGLQLEAL